jgi:hypothetical protein
MNNDQWRNRMKIVMSALALLAALAVATTAVADPPWDKVAEALGKAGSVQAGGVYRVGLPRSDLKVILDNVEIKPGLALGGWLAFEPMGNDAMVMGDLVLTEDEINPVMTKLLASGLEVTALHNHLLRSRPFTMYMHVLGHGDPVKLASALHAALAESKTPMAAPATGAPATSAPVDLDTAALDQTLGAKGANNGGIYQFSIARAEPVSDSGMAVPAAMGSAIAINFQPTGGGKAAITGDFVLIAKEVAPVMKALREHGIEVTALHNHMLDDQPRLYFMHFWAHDDAKKLAAGLKAALTSINVAHG